MLDSNAALRSQAASDGSMSQISLGSHNRQRMSTTGDTLVGRAGVGPGQMYPRGLPAYGVPAGPPDDVAMMVYYGYRPPEQQNNHMPAGQVSAEISRTETRPTFVAPARGNCTAVSNVVACT